MYALLGHLAVTDCKIVLHFLLALAKLFHCLSVFLVLLLLGIALPLLRTPSLFSLLSLESPFFPRSDIFIYIRVY